MKVNQWVFFFKLLKVKMKSKTKIHKFHAALDIFISRSSITRNWKCFLIHFFSLYFFWFSALRSFAISWSLFALSTSMKKLIQPSRGRSLMTFPLPSNFLNEKFPFIWSFMSQRFRPTCHKIEHNKWSVPNSVAI